MTVKTFPTLDVIAAHSGVMLTEGQFGKICAVADHVAGQPLMTHQMASEHQTIADALARQHPWLTDLKVPTMSTVKTFQLTEAEARAMYAAAVNRFAAKVFDDHGTELPVTTDPGYRQLEPLDGLSDETLKKTIVL